MDKKTYLPILFTSYNTQNRLETVAIDQSFKKRIIEKLNHIKKIKSSSSRQLNNNQISTIIPPLFNNANTTNEYFTIEDKPLKENKGKNVCLGRYVNNKEMLSKLVYAKKIAKDNRIIFENKNAKGFFPDFQQSVFYYRLDGHLDATLLFESCFECGNLLAAFKLETTAYQLILQSDTNTTGYNKWFFFMVSNMRKGCRYTFSIINNLRQNKHYAKGIKIFTYSNKKNAIEKIGWHHSGDDIDLYPSNLYQFTNNKKQRLFTLSFTYECEYDNDTIYFANCIPYSYSKIMNELKQYNDNKNQAYTQSTLCKSLSGYDLDYFTLNSPSNQANKQGIVFFARQHPSETVGSWVIQGAMNFLLSQSDEAVYLREHFEILVIPMVNIDGVIAGNTRTSSAGCDLNRKWKRPKKNKHPEIYYIKELIKQFSIKRKIMCLVDFHGHHGAFNSFFYCNYNENDINQARAFPYVCAKNSNCINFAQCSFSMKKYKDGSGRINLYKELGIENACTLETSCFGFDKGKYASKYINEDILKEIGRDVCMGALTYHYYKHSSSSLLKTPIALPIRIQNQITPLLNELNDGKMNINEEDFTDTNGGNSDDDEEDNNNDHNEMNVRDDEDENNPEEDNENKGNENKPEMVSYKYKAKKFPKIKIKISKDTAADQESLSPIKGEALTINKTEEKLRVNIDIGEYTAKNKPMSNHLTILNGTNPAYPSKTHNNSSNKPLDSIVKLKDIIYSTSVEKVKSSQKRSPKGIKKRGMNLIIISPKKFYATRDAITQTEGIYFEMKMIYFIGSHKMIRFDAERERQLNKRRMNYISTFNNANEEKDILNRSKETKSTQTELYY